MKPRGGYRPTPPGGKIFWDPEHWRAVLMFANEIVNEDEKLTFFELAKLSQERAVQAGKLPKAMVRDPQTVQTQLKKRLFPDAPTHASVKATTKALAPNGTPSVVTEEDIKEEPVQQPKPAIAEPPKVDTAAQAKIEELEALLAQATAPEIEGDRTPGAPIEMTVSDIIVKSLLSVVYDPELRRGLKDLVREALAPESTESQERDITWPTPTVTRPWKPRVVVAGADTKAHNRVKEGLKHMADLRFFDGQHGESDARLSAILKGANVAVAYTRYGSHGAMYKVKGWEKARPGRIAIYWGGSEENLIKELEKAVAKVREEVS